MFSGAGRNVIIDLLFNLMLSFVAMFVLAFVLTAAEKKEDATAKNDNNILISMRWQRDNDIDLWVRLPDERKVWYSNRDEPPVHLDVDVVSWRRYKDEFGLITPIAENEEIVTVRSVLAGEYAVNAHYYSANGLKKLDTPVTILIQDVKNKKIIYYGEKTLKAVREEAPFVKFTVVRVGQGYSVEKIYTNRPDFFVGGEPPEYDGNYDYPRAEDD